MTTKKKVTYTLPPMAFSNAMNSIYLGYDFTDWPNSKEWKLFNAGRASAASDLSMEAAGMFKTCKQMADFGGEVR